MPFNTCPTPDVYDLAVRRPPHEFPEYLKLIRLHAALRRIQAFELDREEGRRTLWLMSRALKDTLIGPVGRWPSYEANPAHTRQEQLWDATQALGALSVSMFLRSFEKEAADEQFGKTLGIDVRTARFSLTGENESGALVEYAVERLPSHQAIAHDPSIEFSAHPDSLPAGDPHDQWYSHHAQSNGKHTGLLVHRLASSASNEVALYPYVASRVATTPVWPNI